MIDRDMSSACIQSGSLRPFNMYQASPPMLEPRSPRNAQWQYGTPQIKQEVMDKNDSGVNSGSDFHSSSPGSDTAEHPYPSPQPFYPYAQNPYHHNPLTPPTSEPLVSPKSDHGAKPDEDHLRRLEMTLEKSGLFSSKVSERSLDESSNRSDNEPDDFDEQGLKVPKVNSHGKVKTFKCKQCEFVAITKLEYWDHTKSHIREEKRLTCPKCPFITEYKHHLEYHLRNHSGSKPFRCDKCEYSCVNKSMLNSHMKSHSNIYRYSCADCSYATKYCHSLKIHLRRYSHSPNVVLDEDGNPCPDLIIDVHGTRRGPKVKAQQSLKPEEMSPRPEMLPFGFGSLMNPALQFPGYPFFNGFPNPQLLQQLIRERQALASSTPQQEQEDDEDDEKEDVSAVLDLSKPTHEPKRSRKGPAYKLDLAAAQKCESDEDEEMTTTMFSNVEVVEAKREESEDEAPANNNNNNKGEDNTCQYCSIAFGDPVLYTMHMGYHGFKNPFACNMCGVECADKVSFFLHIARTSHS